MAFMQALKDIFGWGGPRRPMDKPSPRDELSNYDIVRSPADYYHDEMNFRLSKRRDRYDIYDAMDQMADVSSVLDAYAEDACQDDQQSGHSVWIESDDQDVKDELMHLLHRVLYVEDWIEGCARDTSKMGDDFAKINANEEDGITSLFWFDPRDVERIENKEGVLIGFEKSEKLGSYVQKVTASIQTGSDGSDVEPSFEPWEVIHFRLFKRKRMPDEKCPNIYGTSLLAGSERIAKQTKILDDLLMIMRLTRSLDKHTYFVDVGRSALEEEVRILKRWKRALKRKTYVDPVGGRFDSKFDPFGWTEDEFWPVKEGSASRIERHEGITNVADIVDIEHFRDKFFGSLRAPKAYFGYEGDINAKATLSSQSLKWARAVHSLQRAVKSGLKRLCQIHLAYRGLDTSADKFEVMMCPPSIIELLDKLEAWQAVVDVAERMSTLGQTLGLDQRDWNIYILENVMWLTKQEVRHFVEGMSKEGGTPPEFDDEREKPEPPEPLPTSSDDEYADERTQPPMATSPAALGGNKEPSLNLPNRREGKNGHNRKLNLAEIDEAIRKVAARARTRVGANPVRH